MLGKNKQFTKIDTQHHKKSFFDLSTQIRTTFNMGELIPTTIIECLPGDEFEIEVANMLRTAPLVAPMMQEVEIDTHYFFVPNRIMWYDWEDWITGKIGVDPPYITQWDSLSSYEELGLYMGIPIGLDADEPISAFPFAAYLHIFNEYYRDQNLQSAIDTELMTGENTGPTWNAITSLKPLTRAYEHDYFTSCLPSPQRGNTVRIPIGGEDGRIEVKTRAELDGIYLGSMFWERTDGTNSADVVDTDIGSSAIFGQVRNNSLGHGAFLNPSGNLIVDLSGAEGGSIRDLRIAHALQKFLELSMQTGQRIQEYLRGQWGVNPRDSRLQIPEYIGGSKQKLAISEVLTTAETVEGGSVTNPVGQMAGRGISVGGGNKIRFYAPEHGILMGIISVRPKTAYYQGIPRLYSKMDMFDYYTPQFAHVGDQAVYNREIYADGTTVEQNAEVFGYQTRYGEYRFGVDRISGQFATDLNFWTMARTFDTAPNLNGDFITIDPANTKGVFADTEGDSIYAHIFNKISAKRPVTYFTNPM